jgi:rhomboid protease GluP
MDARRLGDWGANFGPYTVLDGEWWRVITVQFLHGSLTHLFFNMWCLCRVGPLQERIYGHLGFLLLYLGSGVGGALLSMLVHPATFSVGASGAIFGLFGGLLAFLLLQPRTVPRALLRPLRASAVAFVLVNLVMGSADPRVDWAAHVGGLLTGFACGLLIQRRWPEPGGAVERPRRLVGAVATLVLLGAGAVVVVPRVLGSPIASMLTHAGQEDAETYDSVVVPATRDLDAISERMSKLIEDAEEERVSEEEYLEELNDLAARGEEVVARVRGVTIGHEQMGRYLEFVRELATHQRDALLALRRYARTGDEAELNGPGGYAEQVEACNRLTEEISDPEHPVNRWIRQLEGVREEGRRDR